MYCIPIWPYREEGREKQSQRNKYIFSVWCIYIEIQTAYTRFKICTRVCLRMSHGDQIWLHWDGGDGKRKRTAGLHALCKPICKLLFSCAWPLLACIFVISWMCSLLPVIMMFDVVIKWSYVFITMLQQGLVKRHFLLE